MAKQTKKSDWRARIEAQHEEARKVVAANCCPDCGSKIRRNLSLTGWYQCEQLGAPGFRARDTDPSCAWQGFTE